MSDFILALDQGTTSSRAILFDQEGRVRATDQHEFKQYFPKPGWVEHDPLEIWESQLAAARGVLRNAGVHASDIAAVGITNQRRNHPGLGSCDGRTHLSGDRLAIAPKRGDLRRSAFPGSRARSSRAHRAFDRRLFLGHQNPLHSGCRPRCRGAGRAWRTLFWDRRQLASLQANGRETARHRVFERL